jgi:hypothetical protein
VESKKKVRSFEIKLISGKKKESRGIGKLITKPTRIFYFCSRLA